MSKSRKIICIGVITSLIATLVFAPWKIATYGDSFYSDLSPIWDGPTRGTLMVSSLAFEWMAIVIIGGIIFAIMAPPKQ